MQQNGNYKTAKALTRIPAIGFAVIAAAFIIAMLIGPDSIHFLYFAMLMIAVLGFFLSPLPFLIISIISTVYAGRAAKEGCAEARRLILIGALETFVCIGSTVVAVYLFFNGQSI